MQPKDYYFAVDHEHDGTFTFFFTSIAYWDKNLCLNDIGNDPEEELLPKGFYELLESVYEYDGEPEEGRAKLLEMGFIQNNDLAGDSFLELKNAESPKERTLPRGMSEKQYLQERLNGAIKCEDFETAAKLRDQISSMK
jgi:hypothetical protein